MAAMPAAADSPASDAVAALVAVTCCDADPSRGDAAVEELAEAVRAAAPRRAWSPSGSTIRARPRGAWWPPSASPRRRARRARGGARRRGDDDGPAEIGAGDDTPLAAALAAAGRAARPRDPGRARSRAAW